MTESTVNPLASPGVKGEIWTDYMWLVVVGALVSFAMAWGIGANDVANSFGTSVGAKTITIFQACLIAMFMEFGGAIALGGAVTSTISGGIARITYFYSEPEIFAFGMLTALCAASMWVACATYLKLAVSTTHSIVGAVLGFALVYGGVDAVVWDDSIPDFPYAKGLVPIICSWFVSPICSSIVAAFLFFTNRFFILRRKNGPKYALWSFPVLLLVTVFINIFFVLYKGAKNELHWDANHAAWVAAIVAAGCGAAGIFPGIWLMKWRMQKAEDKAAEAAAAAESKDNKDVESNEESADKPDDLPNTKSQRLMRAMSKAFMHGVSKDVHATVEMDEKVASIHANAEVFDPKTEHVYQYLQVFSACCVSFAHGANDVANAVGPFAGIWAVYTGFIVSSKAATPRWILALGGAGIVVGLWTYGYNIIQTLGVGMAKMTPSRGFCAELATSFTVVIASAYSLPISTTHCIVGAEVGIGLTENLRHGTNFKLFAKTFAAWVFTIIVAAFLSAGLFALGAYAPSVTMGDDIQEYEQSVRGVINTMNAALVKMNNYTNVTFGYSNSTVVNAIKYTQGNLSNWFNTAKVQGYIPPSDLLNVLNGTVALMFQNSIITVNYATRNATWTANAITVPHTA